MLFDPQIKTLSLSEADCATQYDWRESAARIHRQSSTDIDTSFYIPVDRGDRAVVETLGDSVGRMIATIPPVETPETGPWAMLHEVAAVHKEVGLWTLTGVLDTVSAWLCVRDELSQSQRAPLDTWCESNLAEYRRKLVDQVESVVSRFVRFEKYDTLRLGGSDLRILRDNLNVNPISLGPHGASRCVKGLSDCQVRMHEFTEAVEEQIRETTSRYRDALRNASHSWDVRLINESVSFWDSSICEELGVLELRDRGSEYERALDAVLHLQIRRRGFDWPIATKQFLNEYFHEQHLAALLAHLDQAEVRSRVPIWAVCKETDMDHLLPGPVGVTWEHEIGSRISRAPYVDNPLNQLVLLHSFFGCVVSGLQGARVSESLACFEALVSELDGVLRNYDGCDLRSCRVLLKHFREAGLSDAELRIGEAYHIFRAFLDAKATTARLGMQGWLLKNVFGSISDFCSHAVTDSPRDLNNFCQRLSKELVDHAESNFAEMFFRECGYTVRDRNPRLDSPNIGAAGDRVAGAARETDAVAALNLEGDFFEVRGRVERRTEWKAITSLAVHELQPYVEKISQGNSSKPFRGELRAIRQKYGVFVCTLVARGLLYLASKTVIDGKRLNAKGIARRLGFYYYVMEEDPQSRSRIKRKKRGRPQYSVEEKRALKNFNSFLIEDCCFRTQSITNLSAAGEYSEAELNYLDTIMQSRPRGMTEA